MTYECAYVHDQDNRNIHCVCMYVCMHVCMYVCMTMNMNDVWVCICKPCMYVCMYVCVYDYDYEWRMSVFM